MCSQNKNWTETNNTINDITKTKTEIIGNLKTILK